MITGHSDFDAICLSHEEEDSSTRRCGVANREFKSKNLDAERKRRQKLSDRLLELRSLVPNITNAMILKPFNLFKLMMNKATIITDAITYIENLQNTVKDLSDELYQIDATSKEELNSQNGVVYDAEREMIRCGTETDVQVTHLNGNKLWIQIICQKKNGAVTQVMEAINDLGFYPQDTSVTTTMGALLVTTSVEAHNHCGFIEVAQIKDFLMKTIRTI